MYEILTGLTLDLYPFPSCRFSHSSIFCFRFSSSFWQSIIKQNTHEITTAIHTAALPISNINSSNWSDECLIKQQSRHSLHFDLLGKTYHISGNFCDDLIFVFCTISFKIANYQTTQKLYSLLFSKKTFFNRKKWLMKIKNATYFAVFANFVTHAKPPPDIWLMVTCFCCSAYMAALASCSSWSFIRALSMASSLLWVVSGSMVQCQPVPLFYSQIPIYYTCTTVSGLLTNDNDQ